MTLARWQATIVDEAGNVVHGASIEVRSESAGNPLASLFSDREGLTPIANPTVSDGDGFAFFHTTGGAYRILASKGGFSREWRYVPVGIAGESDGFTLGIPLRFDSDTADADPGAGEFRMNNATPGSVTSVYIDDTNLAGSSIASFLNTFDDGGGTSNRGTIYLQNVDSSKMFIARVTGSVVDGTGYRKLTVSPLVTTSLFTAGETVYLTFVPNGNDGSNGISSGVQFTFSSTTTMADPGTGVFRLNNATLSSVTAAAVDDLSSITGNPDVSAFVLSWDDSTQTNNRGLIIIKRANAPENFAIYRITGATTDNSGWSQLALTYVMHAGSFSNSDICSIEFYRSADAVAAATDTLQGIIELATLAEVVAATDTTRAVVPSTLFGAGAAVKQGKQTVWIPAGAMHGNNAGGNPTPAAGNASIAGSNLPITLATRDFDATNNEYMYFWVAMPQSWNASTVTWRYVWSHGSTTTNFGVSFQLLIDAFSNGNTMAINSGSSGGVSISDTGGTTDTLYISDESAAITIGNGPAKGDIVHFRLGRVPADASDTLAIDARLHGVILYFTTDAPTDA